MKVFYLASIRFPNERAHGIQVAQMCFAFSKLTQVKLVVPRRFNPFITTHKDWKDEFQIDGYFEIKRLRCLDFLRFNSRLPQLLQVINFLVLTLSFFFSSLLLFISQKEPYILYTREISLSIIGLLIGKPTFVELHHFPTNPLILSIYKLFTNKIAGFVCIHENLKEKLMQLGVNKNKIMISPSGISQHFLVKENANDCRFHYQLPQDKYIVTYCGSIQKGKGLDMFIKAAKHLALNTEVYFLIVGGLVGSDSYKTLKETVTEIENIKLIPFQAYKKIPQVLQASDLLVIPNTTETVTYSQYTSPMKLYEYMASNRPILCADVPALKKLSPENSFVTFYHHADSKDLAQKILALQKVTDDEKIVKAYDYVLNLTWEKRAEKIIHFINERIL